MINGFKTKNIAVKSLGERIKASRKRENLTLEQAEEATKVRKHFLKAFEDNDFDNLPDHVYAIGFLARYLEFLKMPNQPSLLTDFKRNWAAWKSMQRHTLTPDNSVQEPKFIVTPKMIFGSLASIAVLSMVTYIFIQVKHLTSPPELTIITPTETVKVAIEKIEIEGKTNPGAVVAINDQVINQDVEGNFRQSVALLNGVNTINVVATNRFNKQTQKTIKVLRTQNEG